ncbi:CYTH domain-containing protein [Marinospirillum sp.]|uniref:CYTH domain-containing protein n=1 Tax=Marinospirillum sp. TaxID=2183934 RepID=UPI002870A34F|nr:CYTH domain-containing protein [Marinospirillum sp.]MDR9468823.1 CYTH domain-containing protein [Marinospirillum sp.]
MAEEIELKLSMQPRDLPRLDRLLADMGAERPQVQRLENTYYDTPDLQLHHAKAALRLRHTGTGWVQTLKTSGKARGALSQRGEWEEAIDEPRLHPELLPKEVINPAWLEQVEAVFTTHFTRKTWEFVEAASQPELRVEIAADSGEVELSSGQKEVISELELELKRGPAEALFTLAEQLAEHICLHPGLISKAERGLRLMNPDNDPPLVSPQLGEQTRFEALNELANHQLNLWIKCHESWTFNAAEAELQEAQRALLRLQGLLVIQQRLCPSAPLYQARVDTQKLLQAFAPLVTGSHADRVLQQLTLESTQASNWRHQHLGYATRRSDYRKLWEERWTGQAGLQLVKSLFKSRCLDKAFSVQAPRKLLDMACAHLRFPRQPLEAEVWVQRYPALVRLQLLLEQVQPDGKDDLKLAKQLIQGIEDLSGYQQLLATPDLPQELNRKVKQARQELLFNLGRWAQALWTAEP